VIDKFFDVWRSQIFEFHHQLQASQHHRLSGFWLRSLAILPSKPAMSTRFVRGEPSSGRVEQNTVTMGNLTMAQTTAIFGW